VRDLGGALSAVSAGETTARPTGAIEIVGPAGSGKTTLIEALSARLPHVRLLSVYATPRNLPLWLWSAFKLLTQLRLPDSPEESSWRKRRWMIRLQAAERILDRESGRGPSLLVFDQGPVYTLAHLRWALRSSLSARGPGALWQRGVPYWAQKLDAVVVLEAGDEVLLHRIRTRSKPHSLRRVDLARACRSLQKERKLYETLIGDLLGARPSLQVLRLDTATRSLNDIVTSVAEFLERGMTSPQRQGEKEAASRDSSPRHQ
jgi:energy-coupling factor transporter ATP-binding protein EcfA2